LGKENFSQKISYEEKSPTFITPKTAQRIGDGIQQTLVNFTLLSFVKTAKSLFSKDFCIVLVLMAFWYH